MKTKLPVNAPTMSNLNIGRIAGKITNALFINGARENADRLVLMRRGLDIGGWSIAGANSQIVEILKAETIRASCPAPAKRKAVQK